MKIASWNVNGIRACAQKGFLKWFEETNADVVCIQENKAQIDQCSTDIVNPLKYHSSWHSAQKKGYSGVTMFSKKEPVNIYTGMDIPEFDAEGRVLTFEYADTVVINAYFPNSQEAGARIAYKIRFCDAMLKFCESFRKKGKNVILCGDYNIAHKPIDLKNPKANEKNAGYLPEERAWMDKFIGEKGYIDAFRKFEQGPDHYTWWTYRFNARAKNVGWRIDYFATNPEFDDRLKSCIHQPQVMGSDHCPVILETK
jgi:exodeoxyribonuclease-3